MSKKRTGTWGKSLCMLVLRNQLEEEVGSKVGGKPVASYDPSKDIVTVNKRSADLEYLSFCKR